MLEKSRKVLKEILPHLACYNANLLLPKLQVFGYLVQEEREFVDDTAGNTDKILRLYTLLQTKPDDTFITLQKICVELKWSELLILIQSTLTENNLCKLLLSDQENQNLDPQKQQKEQRNEHSKLETSLSELNREKQQAESEIKKCTHDIQNQRVTLNEKQRLKGDLQVEVNGKKSEIAAKQEQKSAWEAQLHAVEDQQLANRQASQNVVRQMYDTERQIQQQTTLQQETKRLCKQAEAQVRNTERELNRLTRRPNEKDVIYEKTKKASESKDAELKTCRTSQLAVDQELLQLSSKRQSRFSEIAQKQRDIEKRKLTQVQHIRQTSDRNNVNHPRFEDEEELEQYESVHNTLQHHH